MRKASISLSQETLQNAAATRHRTNTALSFVKLLLNFMQVIVGAGDALQVEWPSAFGWWLFIIERIATLARERHAKALYICAANSRNTVDFYLRHGARVATGAELADEMLEAENSFPEDLRASLGADIHLVRDL